MGQNDGKYLEQEVEKFFKTVNKITFNWRRLPDSRAARGIIPAQPSDFFFSIKDVGTYHLECKSSGSKTNRLKKPTQFPEMRRWALAGVKGLILAHFYENDSFALVDVEDLVPSEPSWVLDPKFISVSDAFWWLL